jgi:hypothetical protein
VAAEARVQNGADCLPCQAHYAGMNQNRIGEIRFEMCSLLDAQSKLLTSQTKLTDMSAEEVDSYAQRNDGIGQLGKDLSGLD